jgi:hypothetical protein
MELLTSIKVSKFSSSNNYETIPFSKPYEQNLNLRLSSWMFIADLSQAPVAHACNPSYSEGRDQEDHGWKPPRASSSQDPI